MSKEIAEAMEVIKQAMIDDGPSELGSYAHSWHCNIAAMCSDAIHASGIASNDSNELIHEASNDAASRFMKLCFDVETGDGSLVKGIKINTNSIKDSLVISQKPTGKFFAGAKLYFYRIDTENSRSAYSDAGLSYALPNPVIADCNGQFPNIFVNPFDGSYRIRLLDFRDNTLLMKNYILLMKDYSVTNGE
jgi:hypothetical protein